MATLVPEGDTLNSCTSFCAKVLSNKKFLAPTVLVLGIASESCIRGGKPDAAKWKGRSLRKFKFSYMKLDWLGGEGICQQQEFQTFLPPYY